MVELMVGMLIALIGTIVIFQVFAVSEEYKRRTTGGSDAIQASNFSLYQLERQLAWVGAGIARTQNLWGCLVQARRADATVLPAPAPFPAPFEFLPRNLRMTPALIHDGGGANPDVVLGISGANDSVNTPISLSAVPTTTNVSLTSTLGVKENDLLMIVEQEIAGRPCPVVQVSSAPTPPQAPATVGLIPNPVNFSASGSWTEGLGAYSASSKVANLGRAVCAAEPCERPRFVAFGIGTDPATGLANVLLTYDLLFGAEAPFGGRPISIADNVVNLQAIYGVAQTATDPKISEWVAPVAPWDTDTLMNGSAESAERIARMRALRIAVVARNAQWERDPVSPPTLTLFADLPALRVTINLSAAEQQYRYKVLETVIPLRNMLIANN